MSREPEPHVGSQMREPGAFGQPSQQGRNLLRREELSSLLPGVAGELLDKEHIGIADDVVVREV
jgi:hypothetical protein